MCSVKEDDETLARIMYRVIAFYEGGISIGAASEMPLPQLFEAEHYAAQIAEENRKALKRK